MALSPEPDLHFPSIAPYIPVGVAAGCDLLIFLAGNSLSRPLNQKIAACSSSYRDLRMSVHYDRALIVAIRSVTGWSRRKQ
jgi:hypothetical protein